jgi:chloramphenicol-sensitive protein RarD
MLSVSLGFYLAPMLTVLLGVTLAGEKLSTWSAAALVLCGIGVGLVFVSASQRAAWPALYIAVSSAAYAVTRKRRPIPPLGGNLFETGTTLLVVAALSAFGLAPAPASLPEDGLWYAMGLGVVTTLPMLLYVYSLNKISLSLNGYLQYLSPTVVFLVAWLVRREPVPAFKLLGFVCVWGSIALYVAGSGVWGRVVDMLGLRASTD